MLHDIADLLEQQISLDCWTIDRLRRRQSTSGDDKAVGFCGLDQ